MLESGHSFSTPPMSASGWEAAIALKVSSLINRAPMAEAAWYAALRGEKASARGD
jgi:hypothetical protein